MRARANVAAVRALFGEETRLEVVSRHRSAGKVAAQYFTKYAEVMDVEDLRTDVVVVEGRAMLAVYLAPSVGVPAYFVGIEWRGERVALVRDYRYSPYIVREAVVEEV